MEVNSTNWTVTDTKLTDKNECLSIEVKTADTGAKTIELAVDATKETSICKKIRDAKIENKTYELY